MLTAIGEPELVDTANNERLSRLFSNKIIKRYPAFSEFYGMEDAIEQIVSFLRHASQGLEESKQVLYLLGPVGGGKSSLAERLKVLMEKCRFIALKILLSMNRLWVYSMRVKMERYSEKTMELISAT